MDIILDGYHNFIFLDRNNKIFSKSLFSYRFKVICAKYEQKYKEHIYVTPHVLRHTFCTRLINNGVSIKIVQYLMGHSSATTTLDIYTHVLFNDVINELDGLPSKDKINITV